MNAAHVHLMVNHLPLFAVLFGGGILALGLLRNDRTIKSIGLSFAIVAGVGAFVSVQSGERSEDLVEALSGTDTKALEVHEDAGKAAGWAAYLAALLALAALVVPTERETLKGRLEWATWAAFVVALVMIARAADIGGAIRHPELVDSTPTSDAPE